MEINIIKQLPLSIPATENIGLVSVKVLRHYAIEVLKMTQYPFLNFF